MSDKALDRKNIEFQVFSSQSAHFMSPRSQALLVNQIIHDMRKIGEKNEPDFLTAFRMKADPDIRRANWTDDNFRAVWAKIRQRASMLATKEIGKSAGLDSVQQFLIPRHAL